MIYRFEKVDGGVCIDSPMSCPFRTMESAEGFCRLESRLVRGKEIKKLCPDHENFPPLCPLLMGVTLAAKARKVE
ncbi:hypothetical protein STSP2_03140 [Anaerohalosphaera lusitana]|uniref:Uncharacterized protein n=1 Tax=Anaerohalosphaera lusitana TaxID=1936003 RepID=A0A1U9NQP4_9BACT|nr:hypothetical protein [Anaerohalosphaera lusitana]AQT69940.1 hypothetical protein STSP2_03140 [Anaerohalosphaera lusitana]